MSYNAKPWLRSVGAASLRGMSDKDVQERGFQVAFEAMRAAYYARHPEARPTPQTSTEGQP